MVSNEDLINEAMSVYNFKKLNDDVKMSEVSAALISESGKVYTGISINASCGIGFCAEHSAIAEMAKNQEYIIKKVVAVTGDGTVVPPCGRCRELMVQLSSDNLNTEVIISKDDNVKLSELLPNRWQDAFYNKK